MTSSRRTEFEKKRKLPPGFFQEESSALTPHQVLMKLTVGEMSDILRASLANGQKPYTPIDWEQVQSQISIKPPKSTDIQAELDKYYNKTHI